MVERTTEQRLADRAAPEADTAAELAATKTSLGAIPLNVSDDALKLATDDQLSTLVTNMQNHGDLFARIQGEKDRREGKPTVQDVKAPLVAENTTGVDIFKNTTKEDIDTKFRELTTPTIEPSTASHEIDGATQFILGGNDPLDAEAKYEVKSMQAKSNQVQENTTQVNNILLDPAKDPATRAREAAAVMRQPVTAKTLGMAVADDMRVRATDAGVLDWPKIGDGIELATRSVENMYAKISNIDPTFKGTATEWTTAEQPWMPAIIQALETPGYRPSLRGLGANAELLSPKDLTGSEVGHGVDGKQIRSVRDFVRFYNPWADAKEGSMDVDGWQLFKDLATGKDPKQFTAAMEDAYGEFWKRRWIGWTIKEIGVDAGITAAVALSEEGGVAALPALASQSAVWSTMKKIAVRAAAVGVGGGTVQSVMNTAIDKPADWLFEVGSRTAGQTVFDAALAPAAKKVLFGGTFKQNLVGEKTYGGVVGWVKSLYTSTIKLAEDRGLIVQKQGVATALRNADGSYTSPLAVKLIDAAEEGAYREWSRLGRMMADGVSAPVDAGAQRTALVKQISDITGFKPNEIAMRFAVNDIFGSELKNVGRTTEETAARKALSDLEPGLEEAKAARKAITDKLEENVRKADKRGAPINYKTDKGSTDALKRAVKLGRELTKANEALAATQRDYDAAAKVVSDFDKRPTSTGAALADELAMSKAFFFRNAGEVQARQTRVNDMFMTYFNADRYAFRDIEPWEMRRKVTELADKGGVGKFFREIPELFGPSMTLRESDTINPWLAKDLLDFNNLSNKLGNQFMDMLQEAESGLNRETGQHLRTGMDEHARVWQLLKEGADNETVYTPEYLASRGLAVHEQDAYFAIRKTLDIAHFVRDRALVTEFERKGYMNYKNEPVKVQREVGQGLGQEDVDKGMVRIRTVPRNGGEEAKAFNVHFSELKKIESVLHAENGYIPISYENPHYQIRLIDPDKATVNRVGVAQTKKQAEALLAKIKTGEEIAPGVKVEVGNKLVQLERWEEGRVNAMGLMRQSMDAVDLLTDDAKASIMAAMEKAGVDSSRLKFVLDNLDGTSLRRMNVGERAERRLVGDKGFAPTVDARAATVEYLQGVASAAGYGQWRDYAIDTFKAMYKDIIDKNLPWHSVELFNKAANKEDVPAAKVMQEWLKTVIHRKSSMEQRIDNLLADMDRKLEADAVSRKVLDGIGLVTGAGRIENWSAAKVNNALRGLGAIPKLLTFATAQVFVQGSQALVTAGAKPAFASAAIKDLIGGTAALVAENTVAKRALKPASVVGEENAHLLFIARQSGYGADLGTTDLMDMVSKNGATADLMKAGAAPFKLGEAMNRMLAFYASRREMIDEAGRGLLTNITGKGKFAGKVDDEEFLRMVVDRAKVTALNMGRAGQNPGLSGFGSVLFQFKQIGLKVLNVFETDELGNAAKARIAGTLIAAFGPQGVPFLGDLVNGLDYGYWKTAGDNKPTERQVFTDNAIAINKKLIEGKTQLGEYLGLTRDEAVHWGIDNETWDRFSKKGGLYAATDGELDLVSRVAMGSFLTEAISPQHPEDAIVSLSVAADLYGAYSVLKDRNVLSPALWLEFMNSAYEPDKYRQKWETIFGQDAPQTAFAFMNQMGKAFSFVGSFNRDLEAVHRDWVDPSFRAQDKFQKDYWTTSSGTPLAADVTKSRVFQFAIGIYPGVLTGEFEQKKFEQTMVKAWQGYHQQQIDAYVTNKGRKQAQDQIIADTYVEAENFKKYMLQRNLSTGFSEQGAQFDKNLSQSFVNVMQKLSSPKSVEVNSQPPTTKLRK